MITTRTRLVAAACALGLAAAGLSACNNASDSAKGSASAAQQAADKAGEAAVDGAQKAKDSAAKAAKDAKEAADKAGDAAKDAADKAGDAAKDVAKDAKDAAADAAKDAKDAAKTAATEAKDAAKDAKDAATSAAAKADAAVKDGDMVEVTDANGAKVEIPAALNAEATKLGASTLGKLVAVKNAGDNWVASYTNGWHVAYSKATGAQPVKGKIGQVWFDGGNISNPVGLPTAPEKTKANNEGWVQSFTKGSIWAGVDGTSGTDMK